MMLEMLFQSALAQTLGDQDFDVATLFASSMSLTAISNVLLPRIYRCIGTATEAPQFVISVCLPFLLYEYVWSPGSRLLYLTLIHVIGSGGGGVFDALRVFGSLLISATLLALSSNHATYDERCKEQRKRVRIFHFRIYC